MYSSFYNYFENVKDIKIEDIQQMIKNGANDWDTGLNGACEGRHVEIVKLMIEKGANDWDAGLGRCMQRRTY